jgi:hypothetical protein
MEHPQISQSTQNIEKEAQKLKIKPSLIYLSLLKSIILGNVNVLKNYHPMEPVDIKKKQKLFWLLKMA